MRLPQLAILSLGVAACFPCSSVVAADVNDFVDFSFEDLPGRLYVPPEAQDSATPRPVILFLHGAGETGTDNLSQINANMDSLLAAAKERGAFLYAPQATTVVGGIFNWSDITRTENVMTMVDQVLAEQNADPNRVYVTGLSMGGGGTWNMLSRFADRFAAAVPIAGVTTAADFDAANLVDKPAWAFHARNDTVVSKDNSRNVVNQILAEGGRQTLAFPDDATTTFEYFNETARLNYTEFPTGGHGIWGGVYNTPEVYDWMFAHSLLGDTYTSEKISLSGWGDTYEQDFDALGSDGSAVGVTLPAAWTRGNFGTTTSTPFPVEETFLGDTTFNAGSPGDTDRALAIGVSNSSDDRFLALRAAVTDAAAASFQLQFDIEAWDARDGTFVAVLNRFVNLPDDPGEAAFQVAVDIDMGDGFVPLADLGTVTTGATLQPVTGGFVDGNADPNRVSFDSGVVNAAIPAGANLRVRWTPDTAAATSGWVFGLDNVALSLINSGFPDGDLNEDGAVDVADLDELTAAVAAGNNDTRFDMDGSGNVDSADRTFWLTDIKETFPGDANLDRTVDAEDLNTLGLNWRHTNATSWSQGDFNGDGNVDASDLNDLGLNWRRSATGAASTAPVPEPSGCLLLAIGLGWFCSRLVRISREGQNKAG